MPKEYPDGHHSRPHQHPRDQLMYAVQGVMQVSAAGIHSALRGGTSHTLPAALTCITPCTCLLYTSRCV